MKEYLKPCPFCGGDRHAFDREVDYYICVRCVDCSARGSRVFLKYFNGNSIADAEQEAKKLWNTRRLYWQPIETAPKDGEIVFLFDEHFTQKVLVGLYDMNGGRWTATLGAYDIDCLPSHWMPLPEPPEN